MPLLERLGSVAQRAGHAVRQQVPDVLMTGGAASISWGAWLLHPSAGYLSAGAFALAAGVLLARSKRRSAA